jgi:hypothetical protein
MHMPEYRNEPEAQRTSKQFILGRWWTPAELQEEATRISNKESRYSAAGRAKILKAVGQ